MNIATRARGHHKDGCPHYTLHSQSSNRGFYCTPSQHQRPKDTTTGQWSGGRLARAILHHQNLVEALLDRPWNREASLIVDRALVSAEGGAR